MAARCLLVSALVGAACFSLGSPTQAITVARVTRHGYIVTDDPGDMTYGSVVPIAATRDTEGFIQDVTAALDALPGFHEGDYVAAMQIPPGDGSALAFYFPIRNDVYGIGQVSPLDGRSEVFDLNAELRTAWPLQGFLYLNTLEFYTDPRAQEFGRYLICTQEFGHRFGATSQIVPYPGGTAPDASVPDASIPDASVPDGSLPDGSLPDGSVPDASSDVASTADGSPDVAIGPLARDALLGRGNVLPSGMVINRAHWSYFFNTGGSPMEGNNWIQTAPGLFQTLHPTFTFSDLDLYNMGLLSPVDVRPSFYIANPTMLPPGISRDSPPEYNVRSVLIAGQRIDIGIQDIVQANGPRRPAYPNTPRDMDVVWVLLATSADVTDALADEFDQAIESCALGYATATVDRGHLLSTTPDAGSTDTDSGTDASADVGDDTGRDTGLDAGLVHPQSVTGGCACDTRTTAGGGGTNVGWVGLALGTLWRRRRQGRACPT